MHTIPGTRPVLYRHHGTWHAGYLLAWRRDPHGWTGDVRHDGHTIPIPAADLRPASACIRCVVKQRRAGWV